MYYQQLQEDELGFDAFIAPDGFDRTAQPVDIYEKFKYWYSIDNKAKYIYYYSDGNYPLTLTPTTDEYYKYGYTRWNAATSQYIDVTEDMPLNSAARTIWGSAATFGDESGYTKRWVIVYRVGTASFVVDNGVARSLWIYCGNKISGVRNTIGYDGSWQLKYIHFANINSITYNFTNAFFYKPGQLTGTLTVPETVTGLGWGCFAGFHGGLPITKIYLPATKDFIWYDNHMHLPTSLIEIHSGKNNLGKLSTGQCDTGNPWFSRNSYINLSVLTCSEANTTFTCALNCDILFNTAQTVIEWIAPLSTRGLYLPDTLPQSEIDSLNTTVVSRRLNTQFMANYQLYIGTQITDLTNLYLSNKSFSTVEVGVGNTAFMAENNILYNTTKTELIKAGTNNTGSLVIDNAVTTIKSGAFLRCVGYTGGLTIPDTVTSIVANSFAGLSGLTGNLVIGNGVTSIVANSFAGVTNLAGNLTIPTTATTIEGGSLSALKNLTGDLIFTGGQWNLSTYNYFGFANFTATSIKSIIDNDQLVNGTVESHKNFYISKTTYDALVALSGGQASIDLAASRFINVSGVVQDGLKLWLDASNPISYPGTGTTWYDLSDNGNNGTMVNGVVQLSNAISFDGVDDYIQATSDDYNIKTGDFSYGFVAKLKKSTIAGVFGKTLYAGVTGRWGVYTDGGAIKVQVDGAAPLLSIAATTYLNAYHFYFVTIDRDGSMKLYIDNVEVGSVIMSNPTLNLSTTGKLFIGGYGNSTGTFPQTGAYNNIEINDIIIYNKLIDNSTMVSLFELIRYKYGI